MLGNNIITVLHIFANFVEFYIVMQELNNFTFYDFLLQGSQLGHYLFFQIKICKAKLFNSFPQSKQDCRGKFCSKSSVLRGRDEKGCLLSTEKKAAVDIDGQRQP